MKKRLNARKKRLMILEKQEKIKEKWNEKYKK